MARKGRLRPLGLGLLSTRGSFLASALRRGGVGSRYFRGRKHGDAFVAVGGSRRPASGDGHHRTSYFTGVRRGRPELQATDHHCLDLTCGRVGPKSRHHRPGFCTAFAHDNGSWTGEALALRGFQMGVVRIWFGRALGWWGLFTGLFLAIAVLVAAYSSPGITRLGRVAQPAVLPAHKRMILFFAAPR